MMKQYEVKTWASGRRAEARDSQDSRAFETFLNDEILPYQRIAHVEYWAGGVTVILEARD